MGKNVKARGVRRKLHDIKDNRQAFKWVMEQTKPHMKSLMGIMVISLLQSGASLGMMLFARNIIDGAISSGVNYNNVILYGMVIVASLTLTAMNSIVTVMVNERFAFSIRIKVYDSVMKSAWKEISKYHSGDIVTRLSSDIEIVATGVAEVIPSIFSLGVNLIVAFGALAFFDIKIALFALFLGPISALIGIITGKKMRPIQNKIQQSESKYKSYMQESVENLVVYKAFNAQEIANTTISQLRKERLYWVKKRQNISAISGAFLGGSFQLGYVVALVYSAGQLSSGVISYGTMTMFIQLVSQIQAPVVGLSKLLPRVVAIAASAARVIEINEIEAENQSLEIKEVNGLGIKAEDITFAYGSEVILENASVDINKGEFVAMMGTSGIGKTTFIRLLMAYLTPDKGSLKICSAEGEEKDINAGVRKYISYVPQGNTLISGRIIDNIRVGCKEISEEEIWELLKVVSVDEFVRSTPQGLYTVIGEKGLGISEGQAQRISICRALAKKAPILILDEATSALDEATEIAVLQHLREHTKGLTCLLISHRKSIMNYCDRCIRIKDKKIVIDSN